MALPPKPILTRWVTWLTAAQYYTENYSIIETIFKLFDTKDADSIEKAQNCLNFSGEKLKNDLAFIDANFSSLAKVIKILESRDLLINESVQMIEDLLSDLSSQWRSPEKSI